MIKNTINYNLIIGGTITAVMLLFILTGLYFTPHDPTAMAAARKFAAPSWAHPFGCDQFGRDILSRVMVGCRSSFVVAAACVLIGASMGIIIGAVTGYCGGILDEILMRVNDSLFVFPSILLALFLVSLMGSGRGTIIVALGIAFIPGYARLVRGEFKRIRQLDYVTAARLAGAGPFRIMFAHILPNTRAVLLPALIIGFNNAVLAESGMSYLGIGVKPPAASLGRMLAEAQSYLMGAPAMAIAPGVALILLILGFSLLSDGLRK